MVDNWRVISTLSLCLCIPFDAHAQTSENPDALLNRIRTKMAAYVQELPNYTCHQVIERFSRPYNSSRLDHLDTVELEVAFVANRELFARSPAMKFEERSINEMVSQGTIGNGTFGSHAAEVFAGNVATFEYVGESKSDGHKALRFNYFVPQEKSHFLVRHNGKAGITGYKGSFWVDAETLDLIRLELKADHIPEYIGVRLIEELMHYKPVKLMDKEFWLPYKSELAAMDSTGTYSVNMVTLEHCKKFSGESVVTFGNPSETNSAARSAGGP